MPRVLAPLKVKILLNDNGQHQYPEFNVLPGELRGNMDWSKFIDAQGLGWHYDRDGGFGKSDDYNDDPACWYGMLVVPFAFARRASQVFPDRCFLLPEEQFEKFYNERSHHGDETEKLNKNVLQAVAARVVLEKELGVTPTDEIQELRRKVLEPDDPTPGVHRNHGKKWEWFKKKTNTAIHHSVCKHRDGGPDSASAEYCEGLEAPTVLSPGNIVIGDARLSGGSPGLAG